MIVKELLSLNKKGKALSNLDKFNINFDEFPELKERID
jgi:hypothetical protein